MEKPKLLLRPDPHDDESLRGYILRLSELNGYWVKDSCTCSILLSGTAEKLLTMNCPAH